MPEDLPPPVVPWTPVEDSALEATGRMDPVKPELEIDPREVRALSRQERKEAKAALRREQQEKRNAARQAKAMAKAAAREAAAKEAAEREAAEKEAAEREAAEREAAAKEAAEREAAEREAAEKEAAEREAAEKEAAEKEAAEKEAAEREAAAAVALAAGEDDVAVDAGVAEEASENVPTIAPDRPEAEEAEVEAPESAEDESAKDAETPEPTDPRARAAQRVQRRLGKDAEKLTAAEARARAREEARRRRAQAKEERSGVVAEEVVRPPDEAAERNLAEDVSVVEPLTEAEPAIEEPTIDQPVDEDGIEEPEADLPKPVVGQRIDEPAPGDDEEQAIAEVEESEPFAQPASVFETPEGPKHVKLEPEPAMDDDEAPKTRPSFAPVAGIVGLIALGISVLLAIGALLVALGFDSGGLYEALRTVANLLVGPLEGAFDFSGANAERKEHFLAWGAGSIGYLLISFVGQAVQRANDDQ